jgi:phage terminase Nu1 subunit (DNA packaging protein)
MVNEEIYILTKHGRFEASYIENIPVYRRRYFLHLLQQENEAIEKEREKLEQKASRGR